jgi:hypothetical protein
MGFGIYRGFETNLQEIPRDDWKFKLFPMTYKD